MNLFEFFAILSVIGVVAGDSKCKTQDELEECVYESAFFLNRNLKLPTSLEEMRGLCDKTQTSIGCLIDFSENCITGWPQPILKRVFGMVKKGVVDRCSTDQKLQEFVDQSSCLHTDDRMEKIRQCSDKHMRYLEIIEELHVDSTVNVGPICCTFYLYHKCVADIVTQECGDAVSDYFESMIDEYKDEIYMAKCENKFDTPEGCAANLKPEYWGPIKEIMDQTDVVKHHHRTTIPIWYHLMDKFLVKN